MKELAIRDLHIGDVVRTKTGVPVSGSRIGCVMEISDGSVYIDEKGYFEPGGSTIIEIFKKDVVKIDEDILAQSKKHIETKVFYGEGVGRKC